MTNESQDAARLTSMFAIGQWMGELRDAAVANGFTRAEALEMCCAWLSTLAANTPRREDES